MLVTLLGVFLGQKAQAYCNPSTGRWLNRDPINELGFKLMARSGGRGNRSEEENLFRFVGNNRLSPCRGNLPPGL